MRALSGKTALVTGASGFIGAATARRLRDAGAIVHGVFRRAQPEKEACTRWWQADLSDIAQVRALVAAVEPDIVFHLASLVSGDRGLDRVLPMLHANLLAAVNLLVATTERPPERLVLAGSLEEPQPDSAWAVPASPYAAAKLAAGAYARMCHALYGTPAVCLRLFMVYGPAQPDLSKLVPYVTLSLLRGEAPALSSGARPVDWVYVDDVVEALLAAAVTDGVEGRTLDVGSGELVTVRGVVERIARLVGTGITPGFGAVPARAFEQVRVADVAETAACLGWRARTPLEEGLARTVDWYRRHGARASEALAKAKGEAS
jgi:nucleoside-diphosphate-sugar epimerase